MSTSQIPQIFSYGVSTRSFDIEIEKTWKFECSWRQLGIEWVRFWLVFVNSVVFGTIISAVFWPINQSRLTEYIILYGPYSLVVMTRLTHKSAHNTCKVRLRFLDSRFALKIYELWFYMLFLKPKSLESAPMFLLEISSQFLGIEKMTYSGLIFRHFWVISWCKVSLFSRQAIMVIALNA